MLPTLDSFGIQPPVYIRKIGKARHWNPEDCSSQQERAEKAAIDVFSDGINSLYLVKSNEDFYAMVAAISANRNPRQQDIYFIWMTEEELTEVGIEVKAVEEGDCLQAKYLHFHVDMDVNKSTQLCDHLMTKNREPNKSAKKKDTREILNYLENLGCKAIVSNSPNCKCENQN